ncbi:MAG: hypothetical protein IANPNBLG_04677 [Bryobacteraceae bacterium]|nr:hypothetical protein [Bryobacteraceae bacterium]
MFVSVPLKVTTEPGIAWSCGEVRLMMISARHRLDKTNAAIKSRMMGLRIYGRTIRELKLKLPPV